MGRPLVAVIPFLIIIFTERTLSHNSSPTALETFFAELDTNADGAIDVGEASSFIGDSIGGIEFDEQAEKADAAVSFLHSIDGGDAGSTVSMDELDVHLHAVLSGVRVWDWVRHGLGLPQYAEAFRNHSITPLDFPMLVQDDGRVLEEELGVSSSFHRLKLVRAIRRQILGLGAPPSQPQLLSCAAGPGGAVAVRWSPPAAPGRPPLHRYVLERAGPAGSWQQVAELDDTHPAAALMDGAAATEAAASAPVSGCSGGSGGSGGEAACAASARVVYRVAAWNLYGRSPYGIAGCDVELPAPPVPPPGYPGAGTAAGAPAVAAAAAAANGSYGARSPGLPRGSGATESEPAPIHELDDALPAKPLHPTSTRAPASAGQGVKRRGGGGGARGRPAADGGGKAGQGWNSLLLLVLPWLLRLLPPSVLQAAVASLQGLLSRACSAARLPTPGWLLPVPPLAVTPPPAAALGVASPVATLPPLLGMPAAALDRAVPQPNGCGALARESSAPAGGGAAALTAAGGALVRQRTARDEGLAAGSQVSAAEATPATACAVAAPRRDGAPLTDAVTGVGSRGVGALCGAPSDGAREEGGGGSGDGSGEGSRHGGRSSAGRLGLLARLPGIGSAAAAAAAAAAGATAGSKSPPLACQQQAPSHAQPIAHPRHGSHAAAFHRCSSESDLGPGGHAGPWAESPSHRGHPAAGGEGAGAVGGAARHPYHHIGSAPSLAAGNLAAAAPGSPAQRNASCAAGRRNGSASGSTSGARTPHHHHANSAEQLWYGANGMDPGGGGGGGWGAGFDADAEAELLAAAAAAARVSGRDRDKVCAIPGCGRKLDLRHYREYARRHFCGRCQQTVCGAHTAYSPHGGTGSCGHESRCVCVICFTHFNPAYQRFLCQRNTLKPAQGAGTGTSPGLPASSSSAADTAALQQPGGGCGTPSRDSGEAAGGGGKSSSKLLWERAATKLMAVTRFRKKGGQQAGSVSSRGPPSMETVVE